MLDLLLECDYLPEPESSFEAAFHVATVDRVAGALPRVDPGSGASADVSARGRSSTCAPFSGDRSLWTTCRVCGHGAVDRDFVHVLANDCLASLPPLTFYQDAVIDSVGERARDVPARAQRAAAAGGRRPGLRNCRRIRRSAARRSNDSRVARTLLPEHEAIFREAVRCVASVLWQQGRVGISQGTSGSELPPAVLSRHDRHLLKGGFRAILRLIEFTGDRGWIDRL